MKGLKSFSSGDMQKIIRNSFLTGLIFLIFLNFYINVWPNEVQNDNNTLGARSLHGLSENSSLGSLQSQHYNYSITPKMYISAPKFPSIRKLNSTTQMPKKSAVIWPNMTHYWDDRILSQIEYKPQNVLDAEKTGRQLPLKKILLYHGFKDWDVKPGQQTFLDQRCPVNSCYLTDNQREGPAADAVLFRQNPRIPRFPKPPSQIWILFLLESPHFTPPLQRFRDKINWMASYRHDSDIVTPYEKYTIRPHPVEKIQKPMTRNYAEGKTKKVAWFVSNCRAMNLRLEYAKQLSKYIQVDIYGKCGNKKCPKGKGCMEMLNKDYKFYLAFENSNCRDYITEKFFVNGLQNDVIPIVMGAAPEDYKRVAPYYSFIHVDSYTGPEHLAEYLLALDADDRLYNEYFRWKSRGTFINTYFWCRVCAMLHDNSRALSTYNNLEEWWRGKEVCIGKHRWGERPRNTTRTYISNYYLNPHRGLV